MVISKGSACSAGDAGDRFDLWREKIPWKGKWQPTPNSLAWKIPWCRPLGHKQVDMTEYASQEYPHPQLHPDLLKPFSYLEKAI